MLDSTSETDWKAVLALAEAERDRRAKRRFIDTLWLDEGPYRRELYPKHIEFFAAGLTNKERGFIAGNRVGKTLAGGTECSFHLTGQYPEWWPGKRFDEPTRCIAAGDTHDTTRDIIQAKLCGPWEDIGTGLIPGDAITGRDMKAGVSKAFSEVYVKHISGGTSTLSLRSYDQGRKVFQGVERHFCWADEEPPLDVWTEMLTRTMATGDFKGGVQIGTFTPLTGMSDVVLSFLGDAL